MLIVCLWFIQASDVVIIGGYMLIVLTFGAYVSSGLLEILVDYTRIVVYMCLVGYVVVS